MAGERVLPVLVSIAVIILVSLVQERSRYLAAVFATMPLTAPLALWIVFSATRGNHRQTAEFALSMVGGFVGALAFIAACWFALSRGWSFGLVLLSGAGAWLALVLLARYTLWR